MKYALTRKINLKRFFPEMQYEMIDFHVEDCDTKEQANKEIDTWIKEYLKEKKEEFKPKLTPEQEFINSLK